MAGPPSGGSTTCTTAPPRHCLVLPVNISRTSLALTVAVELLAWRMKTKSSARTALTASVGASRNTASETILLAMPPLERKCTLERHVRDIGPRVDENAAPFELERDRIRRGVLEATNQ